MDSLDRNKFVRNRTLVILVSAAVLLGAWFYAPYVDHGPAVCIFRGLVGLPCPGCGLTHGFCDLAHGRLASAADRNLLTFPLAALFVAALVVAPVELLLKRRFNFYRFLCSTRSALIIGGIIAIYHLSRVAVFAYDGRLLTDYLATSWTCTLFHHFFG